MAQREKNIYWQAVRGICIIAVVLMHCPSALDYDFSSLEFRLYFIERQFINFPVAVFVFLAGYFVSSRVNTAPKKYVKDRLFNRLIPPFCIWSIIYIGINLGKCIYSGTYFSWKWNLVWFVLGQASPPFYYIVCLLQLTILTPFLVQTAKKKGSMYYVMWFITPVYVFALYIIKILFLHDNSFPLNTLYATLFPAWFGFYWLGICVKNNLDKWRSVAKRCGKLTWFIIAVILSSIESIIMIKAGFGTSFSLNQIRLGSFLYSFVLILIFLNLCENNRKSSERKGIRILTKLGDDSFGIFFVHIMYVYLYSFLLNRIGSDHYYFIYCIIMFMLAMLSSVATVEVVKVVFKNKKNVLQALGMQ